MIDRTGRVAMVTGVGCGTGIPIVRSLALAGAGGEAAHYALNATNAAPAANAACAPAQADGGSQHPRE